MLAPTLLAVICCHADERIQYARTVQPAFIEPMLVSPVSPAAGRRRWIYEAKLNSDRCLVPRRKGGTAVLVQAEHGLYSPISVDRPCLWKSPGTLINGEVMVVDGPLGDVRSWDQLSD